MNLRDACGPTNSHRYPGTKQCNALYVYNSSLSLNPLGSKCNSSKTPDLRLKISQLPFGYNAHRTVLNSSFPNFRDTQFNTCQTILTLIVGMIHYDIQLCVICVMEKQSMTLRLSMSLRLNDVTNRLCVYAINLWHKNRTRWYL